MATPTEFISNASVVAPLKVPWPGVHRQVPEVTPLPKGERKPPSLSCLRMPLGQWVLLPPTGSLCLLCVAQQVLAGLSCRADRVEGVGGLGTAIACTFSAWGSSDLISLHQRAGQLFLGHSLWKGQERKGRASGPCSTGSTQCLLQDSACCVHHVLGRAEALSLGTVSPAPSDPHSQNV